MKPCDKLAAKEVKSLPLVPFEVFDKARQQRKRYAPSRYHEQWVIQACGDVRVWRVFDESMDDNRHTVLLGSAG